MKKWQKAGLTLLISSLAIGSIAQGEAALIKLERVNIVSSQPIQVIVIDANGRIFERTVTYNPSLGGIDIDTSWAGPNASIFIPALGIGYVWYNGYWVDQEGYYWNGSQRVTVPHIPQWREHWNHYWYTHHVDALPNNADGQREGKWQERERNWQERGQFRMENQDRWNGNTPSSYQKERFDTMRSASEPQGTTPDSNLSPSGQPAGAIRSAGAQGRTMEGGMNRGNMGNRAAR